MWFPIERFKIVGHSMEPFFREGQLVFINRLSYLFRSPKVGDIIALKNPLDGEKTLLKKIEKISSKDKYFVTGLNENDSLDSRTFGPVSKKLIMGKVIK